MELLQGLNEEQRLAVTTTEGFVRVIAGAGSGKTRALSHRFAYLVNEIGIMPSNILCVTFTNKSANEMKQRIRKLTGDNDTGYINTFHGFCVSVIQEDGHALQYPKSFLVLDNSDIDDMLKGIYEERGLTLRDKTFSQARDMIEIRKVFTHPRYYEDMIALPLSGLQEKYQSATETNDIIFYGYLYQQKKCFGLDYNDLIKFSLYLFEISREIRLKWQERLAYIMIDEFQDIDELQYRLMKVLCEHHKNLFVVGDPDQTIYTWRGANVRYLLDFDKEFPGTKTIMMMKNYRSTPQILYVANSLISANKDRIEKELLPMLPPGEEVYYHHAKTAEDEARWIAEEINKLRETGVDLSEVAVLYRAHYVSRMLEETFLKESIPYTIYSGIQFFGRMEIKDALSYLRLLVYKDDLSFARVANVPKRNIGKRRMEFLQSYADEHGCTLYKALCETVEQELFVNTKAKRFIALVERLSGECSAMPVSELLSKVLDESGYEAMLRTEGGQERLDNLAELKQAVHEYEISCGEECSVEAYLSHAALFSNADTASVKDSLKMMTVHTAKGLEFPYVFLCSMDEGVFPSRKTATIESMEEERRLAFVAMTRAEKRLYLSEAEGRNFDGSFRYPSRFLFDIDPLLLHYTAPLPESLIKDARRAAENSNTWLSRGKITQKFEVGDRVRHEVMGAGVIETIDAEQKAYTIRFDELPTSRRISFRAGLTPEK